MKRTLFFCLMIGLFAFSAFAQGASDGGRAKFKEKKSSTYTSLNKYGGGGADTGGKGKFFQETFVGGGSETVGKGKGTYSYLNMFNDKYGLIKNRKV